MPKKIQKIKDLTPDERNANRGTDRGAAELEESVAKRGAGRSILLDSHGRIIAGNKTTAAAAAAGIDEVIVVQTDGSQLVAVQRTDLDLETDDAARRLAYDDNRVGQLSLDIDPDQLFEDIEAGVDLGDLWLGWELDELEKETIQLTAPGDTRNDYLQRKGEQIKAVLFVDQVQVFEAAILATGIKNRGEAITAICEFYIEETKGQFDGPAKNIAAPLDIEID